MQLNMVKQKEDLIRYIFVTIIYNFSRKLMQYLSAVQVYRSKLRQEFKFRSEVGDIFLSSLRKIDIPIFL